MANNKSLSPIQAQELMTLGIKTWNNKMSINEQKNIISQLFVELNSNLKTANELKLNTETILSSLNLISSNQILRNPKIQILPLFFPAANLDNIHNLSVTDLVEKGIIKYQSLGLDTNQIEKQKFSAVGKIIALTIDKTFPTLTSLSDKEGVRYQMYSNIWQSNATNLSKIDIFDVTKFQKTYSELNSLRNNYNIVINRATDYLSDLKKFFNPENNTIRREGIEKILTSERLAYNIIVTYSKSLIENIESLSALQKIVNETLR